MSEKKRIFAVAGNPVLHSLSPVIFNAVFTAEGKNAVYTRILAEKSKEIIEIVKQIGIDGINVTSPFKEEILRHIDTIDEHAKRIGAVNTVINNSGSLKGYNTDTHGVKWVFIKKGIDISGKKAMVAGAGGAARAACFVLKSNGADVTVINRTYEKAYEIASCFGLRTIPIENLDDGRPDAEIFVQCIPRDICLISPEILKKGVFILDANYSSESIFIKRAEAWGHNVCGGKDWLVYQGVESYRFFTGQYPPVHIMEEALRNKPIEDNKTKSISLVGFMGTGKSTVAASLSKIADLEPLDIDSMIEKRMRLSIKEIFQGRGEGFFRKIEEEEIERVAPLSKRIISCGGGAVISQKNRRHLRENSIVIWLWARPEYIFQRIHDDSNRPVVKGINNTEALKSLIRERIPFYADVADMIVGVDDKTPDEIARRIYDEIHKFLRD